MITLTKDKIIHTNGWGEHSDKFVREEVSSFWGYLEDAVQFSDDFTLGDLFRHLQKLGEPFVSLIFGSALGHLPFQLFIDDMKTPAEDEGDKLTYLEVRRYGERWEHSGEIDLHIGFSGVGESKDFNYAIEFTSLYLLKDLPLRLNKEFEISEMRFPSRILRAYLKFRDWIHLPVSGWNTAFSYVYVKGPCCFSVYEVIVTILSELSFVGEPEMRDRELDEVITFVNEIKQELSDGR